MGVCWVCGCWSSVVGAVYDLSEGLVSDSITCWRVSALSIRVAHAFPLAISLAFWPSAEPVCGAIVDLLRSVVRPVRGEFNTISGVFATFASFSDSTSSYRRPLETLSIEACPVQSIATFGQFGQRNPCNLELLSETRFLCSYSSLSLYDWCHIYPLVPLRRVLRYIWAGVCKGLATNARTTLFGFWRGPWLLTLSVALGTFAVHCNSLSGQNFLAISQYRFWGFVALRFDLRANWLSRFRLTSTLEIGKRYVIKEKVLEDSDGRGV